MYESFFGLRERPFDLTPNPRFLLVTSKHREALVNLEFGIASRKGVVMLIGEPGTGKTTIARALIAKQRDVVAQYVYLGNSALTRAEFLQFLARAMRLSQAAETSKTTLLSELAEKLAEIRQGGRTVALLVDEAQSLSDDLLEEIRLLTNIETNEEKLLTLILIGQPKLAERLNDERWTQLKQRIEIRSTLAPFNLNETMAYIWSRIRTAGGDGARLFTAEAVHLVHDRSRGIPRSISVICENALISGFAEHVQPVTRRLVRQVCDELDLADRQVAASLASQPGILQFPESNTGTNAPGTEPLWRPAPVDTESDGGMRLAGVAQPRRRWWPLSKAGLRS